MNHSILPCTNDAAAQEAAEVYVLERMPAPENERYEEHLLVCPRCQDAVQESSVFFSAARVALAEYQDGRRHRHALGSRAKSASC